MYVYVTVTVVLLLLKRTVLQDFRPSFLSKILPKQAKTVLEIFLVFTKIFMNIV